MECDPSIKSIIVKLDSEKHEFIVEELDDQTLVIREDKLSILKMRLEDVRLMGELPEGETDINKALKETQQPADDSGSN